MVLNSPAYRLPDPSASVSYTHLDVYKRQVLKQGASKEEANDIKAKLEAEGAKVTLK